MLTVNENYFESFGIVGYFGVKKLEDGSINNNSNLKTQIMLT